MKNLVRAFALLLSFAVIFSTGGCATKDTTAPGTPTAVSTTTAGNDTTPTFSWTAADDDSGVAYYLASVDGWIGETWRDIGDVTTYTLDTALSDGSHTFRVMAVDKAGNKGSETSCVFTVDTTDPVISDVNASALTASGATITWTTDEKASSKVGYGITAGYGLSSALDSSLVTTHTVNLTGLAANSKYHYKVRSADAAGNVAESGDFTFTTPQPVTGVTLNKTSTTIVVGLSEQLVATILPPNATNQSVVWSSTDSSIASVDTSGLVTATNTGTALITATTVDQALTANCTVTVIPEGQLPALEVGDKWTYDATYEGSYYTFVYEITGEGKVNGEDCWITEVSITPAFMAFINGMTIRMSKGTLSDLQYQASMTVSGLPMSTSTVYSYAPSDASFFPLVVGNEYSVTATLVTTTTALGDSETETTTQIHTIKVEAVEQVTVQAGTFKCFKITDTVDGETNTFWYSDAVKLWVKEVHNDGSIMELKSYSV